MLCFDKEIMTIPTWASTGYGAQFPEGIVSIGTKTPGDGTSPAPNLKLEVDGDVVIQDEHMLCFDNSYYNHGFMKMVSNTRLHTHAYYGHRFTSYQMGGSLGDDGNVIMYLSGSGGKARVGIGTDTPQSALQVIGAISASGDINLHNGCLL